MMRFPIAGLTGIMAAAFVAPVMAADLPVAAGVEPVPYEAPVPPGRFDWSGAYVGGNLGWGWGNFDNSNGPDTEGDGVQGGFHAGYNYLIAPDIVLGAEADFQFSDLDDTAIAGGTTVTTSSDWNSSIRGRLGYAFDRFMIYGTGGLAIADVNFNANGAKDSTTAVGWTAGAGVEGALTNHVTARLEYVHQDFGSESFTLGGTRYSTDLDENIVRFGLSYKF